LGPGVGPML